ncbi:hypothetical protein Esti_001571 [Eimeria stiedai]
MSKLSAFFEKKKKKVTKGPLPAEPELLIEKPEEEQPLEEVDEAWGVQPQQEPTEWGPATAATAAAAGGGGALPGSLRVSAVGACEVESKKDRSWSAMKRLDEEQRRGLQELREQEARELLLLQQQQRQLGAGDAAEAEQQQLQQEPEADASSTSPTLQGSRKPELTPPPAAAAAAAENKPWVSARLLRAVEGGSLRRGRAATVPSFDEDPDLVTAVQMASGNKQQHQQKQQQGKRSPFEPQQQFESASVHSSPQSDCKQQRQQQQSSSSTSGGEEDDEMRAAAATFFVFDVRKFISFEGLKGADVPLSDSQVRAKYEKRQPFAAVAAAAAAPEA